MFFIFRWWEYERSKNFDEISFNLLIDIDCDKKNINGIFRSMYKFKNPLFLCDTKWTYI